MLSMEGKSYFAGLLGQLLTEDMRQAGRFRQGDIVPGELFDAEIVEADDRGVWRIKFTFTEPLAADRFGWTRGGGRDRSRSRCGRWCWAG